MRPRERVARYLGQPEDANVDVAAGQSGRGAQHHVPLDNGPWFSFVVGARQSVARQERDERATSQNESCCHSHARITRQQRFLGTTEGRLLHGSAQGLSIRPDQAWTLVMFARREGGRS
jgi:hypothetical protein